MSNNLDIKDGNYIAQILKTTDISGVHTPHHIVDESALPNGASTDRTTAAGPFSVRLSDGAAFYNVPASDQLPAALVGGRLDGNIGAWMGATTPTVGQKTMAASIPVVIPSDQSVINVNTSPVVVFRGRSCTFRTPGRAGTTGQKIMSVFNGVGSGVTVSLVSVTVSLYCTVVKAIAVPPPIVRLWEVTSAPTNGTALTKTKAGGSGASSPSVAVLGDASADGTGSGTTLTIASGTAIYQQPAPRIITSAGAESANAIQVNIAVPLTIPAGEGVVVFLDYTAATSNPITDMWFVTMEWTEQ